MSLPTVAAPSTRTPSVAVLARGPILASALIGLLAAGAAVAVGHLVAGLTRPSASPLLAVASTFIDLTPEWLKSFAIATFGSQDKIALLAGVAATLALLAIAIGLLSYRHPRLAVAGIVGFALVGAAAAWLRPTGVPASVIPALVGGGAGVAVLAILHRLLVGPARDRAAVAPDAVSEPGRRGFLAALAAIGALTVVSGGLGVFLADRRAAAAASGRAVTVPSPTDAAPPVPAGVASGAQGVSLFVTPNADFYRVDTALEIPAVAADEWRLRIHGMVDREVTLTYDELIALPTIERDITLTCVSNVIGGPYVGNARWIGVPLAVVLELAGTQAGADQLVSRSIDGMTIGTPTAIALDGRDAMLAIAMNGVPLPAVHGYPVRMIVPGLYGYVSATKWLVDLELTTFDAFDPYWVERGWSREGPIKTMSRIDAPAALARLKAGPVAVGGVAWAQHLGVQAVEVRVDGGAWAKADLAAVDTIDTWRQWTYAWDATAGNHTLEVRATDAAGSTQTDARVDPFPDGATGWHSVVVSVA